MIVLVDPWQSSLYIDGWTKIILLVAQQYKWANLVFHSAWTIVFLYKMYDKSFTLSGIIDYMRERQNHYLVVVWCCKQADPGDISYFAHMEQNHYIIPKKQAPYCSTCTLNVEQRKLYSAVLMK